MSYSESEAKLLLFSSERHTINRFSKQIKKKLDKKGAQFKGPSTPPVAKREELVYFLMHIKDPDSEDTLDKDQFANWLFDAVDSKENLNIIVNAAEEERSMYARKYLIIGNRDIQTALSFELPDSVGGSVQLGEKKHPKGGENSPYTWDPSVDHIPTHPDGR